MVRYHLALDGSGASARQADAPAARPARLRLDHRRPPARRCPAPRRWSSATTSASSTTTSRTATSSAATAPTLWTRPRHPAGDQHRRHAVQPVADRPPPADRARLLATRKVLRLMRLYDETCLRLCEGQYIDIWTSEHDEHDVGRALLRHDRAQDGGPHRGLDRGRRAARHRRRGGHRPLPRLRLGARARLPAQRRPARHLGRGAGDRQGAVRPRPPQEDAAGHLRLRARRPRGPRAPRGALRGTTTRRRPRSPRRSRSSSAPAPATTPATRPAATATRRSPSSTRRASSSPRPRGRLEEIIVSVISA